MEPIWNHIRVRASSLIVKARANKVCVPITTSYTSFKWIRILHRCWLDRTPYDESRYLMALQKKGSPLLAGLVPAQNL